MDDKIIGVVQEQQAKDWSAEFSEHKLPEVTSLTRKERRDMQAAGFDLRKIETQALLTYAKLAKQEIPSDEEIETLGKALEAYDYILDHKYPNFCWDNIPDDVCVVFAQKTWQLTSGQVSAFALKN